MIPARRQPPWFAIAIVLSGAFAVLAHASIVEGVPPAVGALLSLIPLALIAIRGISRARHRGFAIALLAIAVLAVAMGWSALERHFSGVFFLEHAGINLVLAIVFGRTLVAAREPMITRFARLLHDGIPPEVARYTRQVTLAWTIFFALLFVLSCALYLGGFLVAWSVLANIASPILIVAMFVGEYAVRHRVLPDWERVGILGGIRAFSRHFGSARFEAPR